MSIQLIYYMSIELSVRQIYSDQDKVLYGDGWKGSR